MLEIIAVKRLIKIYDFAEAEAKRLVNSYMASGKYPDLCEFLKAKIDTSPKEVSE